MSVAICPDTAEWLDGPALAAWLRDNGLDHPTYQLGHTLERAVSRWRDGARAYVFVVDAVLTKLGLHLSEIPDELWTDAPQGGASRLDSVKRAELLARLAEGEPVKAIARKVGCSSGTVRHYRGKQDREALAEAGGGR